MTKDGALPSSVNTRRRRLRPMELMGPWMNQAGFLQFDPFAAITGWFYLVEKRRRQYYRTPGPEVWCQVSTVPVSSCNCRTETSRNEWSQYMECEKETVSLLLQWLRCIVVEVTSRLSSSVSRISGLLERKFGQLTARRGGWGGAVPFKEPVRGLARCQFHIFSIIY